MSDPSNAMFHRSTSGKIENNKFINSGRDTTYNVHNYNVFPDVIGYIKTAAQPFVAWVYMNQSTGTDGRDPLPEAVATDHAPPILERDPVEISNIIPPNPSTLPLFSIADRYTRSMLECLVGYPLYEPELFCEFPTEYSRKGVHVGDVGFIREDGAFDFLFNIGPLQNSLVNPSDLPHGFSLPEHSKTRRIRQLSPQICLLPPTVTKTPSGEFICKGPEGAILVLPEGAIQEETINIGRFEYLAKLRGVEWYKYTKTRGRSISNGSLYLVTSFTKCARWGIAVFDRPCDPGQGLTFVSSSPICWQGSDIFATKVSDLNKGDTPNQCVFLRGYKIMIRQDIFDNLCNDQPSGSDPAIPSSAGSITLTRQPATRIRGGGGSDLLSRILTAGGNPLARTTMPIVKKSDEVVLHANFNSPPVHPSDLINAELLSQVDLAKYDKLKSKLNPCQIPDAKVALTHDDVWCDLMRDSFPKLDYAKLMNIARSYTSTIDEYGCVSLAKITSVPAKTQQTLPRELVERILLLLDTELMLTCRLVNREFNNIVQSSTLLQYFLACKAAGVIDNPRSLLSCGERLEALKKREDAWRTLKPSFETTIEGKHQLSLIYKLTAGTYLLSDNNRKDLYYSHLPSSPQDNMQWTRIQGHGPAQSWSGFIVDMGMALYEHDLIVIVISSEVGNQTDMQRHSLDLVLLKFSTGEYHPLAYHPRIHVQRSPSDRPLATPRIVGDNLALTVYSHDGTFPHKLFIFDWKTGHKRLQHETTQTSENAYSGLEFISPELLLVPNLILCHFEVWHIPPSGPSHWHNPEPPVQILSLQIPAVSRAYSILNLNCHGYPSQSLHSIPYFTPRPFFPAPENSIIIANLHLEALQGLLRASYTLVIRRRALLDAILKWTSPSLLEQKGDLPTWLTNEATVHKIADPDDGLTKLGAQSKLVSMELHPRSSPRTRDSQVSPTSHIYSDSSPSSTPSGSFITSTTSHLQVPWADWGPTISRWFQVNETQTRMSTTLTGQRCAFLFPDPRDRGKSTVTVADFNPHNYRKNEEVMTRLQCGQGGNNGNNGNEEEKEEENLEILDHEGVFSEEVHMGLKCVVYHAPDEYDFDGVLMDEERLLGLKHDHDGRVENVKVLYFG